MIHIYVWKLGKIQVRIFDAGFLVGVMYSFRTLKREPGQIP